MFQRFRELHATRLNAMIGAGQPVSLGRNYFSLLDWSARAGALLVGAFGVVVMAGWFLHVEQLKSLWPGLAPVRINTACGFAAAGLSLWLQQIAAAGSQSYQLARVLAVFVAMLGAAALAESVFGVRLGLDQFILPDNAAAAAASHSGGMSPLTESGFFFAGLALVVFKARDAKLAACSQWLAVIPLAVSLTVIAGLRLWRRFIGAGGCLCRDAAAGSGGVFLLRVIDLGRECDARLHAHRYKRHFRRRRVPPSALDDSIGAACAWLGASERR